MCEEITDWIESWQLIKQSQQFGLIVGKFGRVEEGYVS